MKKITVLLIIGLILSGCAPMKRLQKATEPIRYDNTVISIVADNVLLFPKMTDKDFIPLLSTRLNDITKTEIAKQGNLKIISACEPRTLKFTQEITGITVNTVTDVNTGFFMFQIIRGSATSTKSDVIYINTVTTISDCETGKILGSYPYQSYGQNPVDILQSLAYYNVYYVYDHQRSNK